MLYKCWGQKVLFFKIIKLLHQSLNNSCGSSMNRMNNLFKVLKSTMIRMNVNLMWVILQSGEINSYHSFSGVALVVMLLDIDKYVSESDILGPIGSLPYWDFGIIWKYCKKTSND